VKLVRGFSAFGFVKLLRVCNLCRFVMESVDTVHILCDDDNACAHGDTAGVGNVCLSCGGMETLQHTEVTRSIVQWFVETNIRIGEQVAAKEEAAWQVTLEKLSANQKLWLPYHHNSPVWAFFALKDRSIQKLDTSRLQMLRCVLCHPTAAASSSSHTDPLSKNTRKRVGLLKYASEHGLTSMKKHVEREHQSEFGRYSKVAKDVEDAARLELQKGKKRNSLPPSSITKFFSSARPYKRCEAPQIRFIEDLALLVAKGCIALSMVENPWLRRLVLCCDARVVFPTRSQLVNEHIPNLLATTMERYVYPLINNCEIVTVTFDLWLSRAGYDTFAAVVNFVDKPWIPQHVTMGLFDAPKTSGVALAEIVKPLLRKCKLENKVIAYMKDESSNLRSLEKALIDSISCIVIGLKDPYPGVCFGHVMSKACQYATTEDKVYLKLKEVSLKDAQIALQKTIT
jgi:hypothetical protein